MTAGTWVSVEDGSAFGLDALPYGVFSTEVGRPRLGARIGELVLDLGAAAELLAPHLHEVLAAGSLDALLAAGRPVWGEVRRTVQGWLADDAPRVVLEPLLRDLRSVRLHLPFTVADYVDFYSSRHHAENLGAIFRPGQPALTPNWLHLPIGYHGRAGTVVVSGTDVVRPSGQRRAPGDESPSFGPSRRLDIEAEVGFVVGTPSALGRPVAAADVAEHVFGVVLVNDWSARDIQAWEYVPLGPFLGKSFATSISAWVLPLEALDAARVPPPERALPLLPYLADGEPWGLDLRLEVRLNGSVVSRPPFASMYWTPAQQLAHLTANGASLRTGDLYASGTVSGPSPDELGSLIELSWNAARPLTLADGSTRTFLEDGDEVVITATGPAAGGGRAGLGEVRGRIVSG